VSGGARIREARPDREAGPVLVLGRMRQTGRLMPASRAIAASPKQQQNRSGRDHKSTRAVRDAGVRPQSRPCRPPPSPSRPSSSLARVVLLVLCTSELAVTGSGRRICNAGIGDRLALITTVSLAQAKQVCHVATGRSQVVHTGSERRSDSSKRARGRASPFPRIQRPVAPRRARSQ